MESLYFIVGTLKATVPMVRVLDIVTGVFRDMTVDNLIGCINNKMLHIENAKVKDGQLVMIDGDLDRYGVIVRTDKGIEVDPVAVVISEIVDDNNDDVIIGYRMGNTDGSIYNYLIKDIQDILKDYPVANAEAYQDDNGIYWLKKGELTLPKIKKSMLVGNAQESAVETEPDSKTANVTDVQAESVSVKESAQKHEDLQTSTIEEGTTEQEKGKVESTIEEKSIQAGSVPPWLRNNTVNLSKSGASESKLVDKVPEKVEAVVVEKKEKSELLDTDWVVTLKDGRKFVGDLEDIAADCGLNGYTVENGVLLSDVQTGNNSIVSIKLPKGINSLGSNIFKDFSVLEVVELPHGVKTIGVETFAHCTQLREVKGTMYKICRGAFLNCTALTVIDLSVVSVIEDYAFSKCSAIADVCLEQITTLGNGVFFASGLERVKLGKALRNCGAVIFANCFNLVNVEFEAPTELSTMLEHNYRKYNNVTKAEDILDISFACMFLNCKNLEDINLNTDDIAKYNNYMFKGSSLYI